MLKKRKMQFSVLLLVLSFSLTGCLGLKNPEDKIFKILEDAAEEETSFEQQQNPLIELEKKEKDLYDKIISLGSKEHEEIVKLSDDALTAVSERKKHIDKEQQSLKKSKEKFEKASPLISDIKDTDLKSQANQLYEIMMQRYEIHDELYENYLLGIKYDTELYKMLKNKAVSLEQLEDQITKINSTYEKVLNANKQFNEKTKKYNDSKMTFYKKAGFNVKN